MDRLTPAEFERVLRRALSIDAQDETAVPVARLYAVAAELGISPRAVDQALERAEDLVVDVPAGVVSIERLLPLAPAPARARLVRGLRRRLLDPRDGVGDSWVQRRGWWPDPRRTATAIYVDFAVDHSPAGSHVTLSARVASLPWIPWVVAFAAAMATLSLIPGALSVVRIAAATAAAAAAVVVSRRMARSRLEAVARRLTRWLDEVAAPPPPHPVLHEELRARPDARHRPYRHRPVPRT